MRQQAGRGQRRYVAPAFMHESLLLNIIWLTGITFPQVTSRLTCYLLCVRIYPSIQPVVHGADRPRLHTHTNTHTHTHTHDKNNVCLPNDLLMRRLFSDANRRQMMCHTFLSAIWDDSGPGAGHVELWIHWWTLRIRIRVIRFPAEALKDE